jgi:cell division protein FtsN
MLDSQQKRKINKVLYHKVTLVILGVVVLLILHSTWVVYQKKLESDDLKNISLKYKDGLEIRETELQNQINRLETEAGKEAEIRSKFSVAKERENIVVVVNEDVQNVPTTTKKNLWQKFVDLFNK